MFPYQKRQSYPKNYTVSTILKTCKKGNFDFISCESYILEEMLESMVFSYEN